MVTDATSIKAGQWRGLVMDGRSTIQKTGSLFPNNRFLSWPRSLENQRGEDVSWIGFASVDLLETSGRWRFDRTEPPFLVDHNSRPGDQRMCNCAHTNLFYLIKCLIMKFESLPRLERQRPVPAGNFAAPAEQKGTELTCMRVPLGQQWIKMFRGQHERPV